VPALNRAYGTHYASFSAVNEPRLAADWEEMLANRRAIRHEFIVRNYRDVAQYIMLHGRSIWNTAVLVAGLLLVTLIVNPLAAYALSRYRLPGTYKILLFLLATMAFPGEVLMIPNFLQIKSFPIMQICTVAACLLAFALLHMKLGKRLKLPPVVSATAALAVIVFLAGYAAPKAAGAMHIKTTVSLMNSFWALILPAMANGYGIFLLKGFFDSLPPELYEAGLIDGASEMTMFWKITLPLCKPILAVLALGAFTAA
jgi:ABC-type glycerol-3-phosphate transport system permease component